MGTPGVIVTRAAQEISHDVDFDSIYEKRFRKYLMLLEKEKELLRRMRGRSRRHRSSTISNGLDANEIDLALAESGFKDDIDSCFYNPKRSSKDVKRRNAVSVKETRKLSSASFKDFRRTANRQAVFFDKDFDINRLSVRLEAEEINNDDETSDTSSSSSSYDSFSHSSYNLTLPEIRDTITSSRSMENILQSNGSPCNSFKCRENSHTLNSSNALDYDGDDDSIDGDSIASSSLHARLSTHSRFSQISNISNLSRISTFSTASEKVQTTHSPIIRRREAVMKKSQSFDDLLSDPGYNKNGTFEGFKKPAAIEKGVILRNKNSPPQQVKYRRAQSFKKAVSYEKILVDNENDDNEDFATKAEEKRRIARTRVSQKHVEKTSLRAIRSQSLRRATSIETLLRSDIMNPNFQNYHHQQYTGYNINYGTPVNKFNLARSKKTLITSSHRNLADRNVREQKQSMKGLRSENLLLKKRLAEAKEKRTKREETMKSLDTDFTKAKEIIKKYKSTETLNTTINDCITDENKNESAGGNTKENNKPDADVIESGESRVDIKETVTLEADVQTSNKQEKAATATQQPMEINNNITTEENKMTEHEPKDKNNKKSDSFAVTRVYEETAM